jgi:hypothetical protein
MNNDIYRTYSPLDIVMKLALTIFLIQSNQQVAPTLVPKSIYYVPHIDELRTVLLHNGDDKNVK